MPKNTVELRVDLKTRLAQQYQRMASRVKNYNSQISNSMAKVGASADKSFGRVRNTLTTMGSSIKQFATSFGPVALAIGALTFAVRGLGKAVTFVQESTENFQKSMSKIKAIVQPTAQGFADLNKQAKSLGETTAFSASQASDAFVELGKIGFNTNQIIEASADVLNLAAVAETDMATSATVVGETMAGFGIKASEANRVVDVMAKSFSSSALDMTKFSESAKYVSATAGALKIPLEDTTGALSALANAGIHGSMAGTSLRKIMLMLSDSSSKAGKMIGVTADDTRTFAERLEALQNKGLSPSEIKATFGLLATTSATVLIKANKQVKEFTGLYEKAQGTAKTMAEIMLDNVAGATQILESAQEGLALAIGETFGKAKQKRIEYYTRLFTWLKDTVLANKDEFRKFGEQISVVLMWLARVAQIIAGGIIQNFGLLKKVFVAIALMKMGGVFMAMVGGIRALSSASKGAKTSVKLLGGALKALQSIGIILFLVGLQIAISAVIKGMDELKNSQRDYRDGAYKDIQAQEQLLIAMQQYEKQTEIMKKSIEGLDLGIYDEYPKAYTDAQIEQMKWNNQIRDWTNLSYGQHKAMGTTIEQTRVHISKLKEAKIETDKLALAEKAKQDIENAVAGAGIVIPGGGGGTGGDDDESKKLKKAEEQAKKIAELKRIKTLESAERLKEELDLFNMDAESAEFERLEMWYEEKSALLISAYGKEKVDLTALNEAYHKKDEKIYDKYREIEKAKDKQKVKDKKAMDRAIVNSYMQSGKTMVGVMEYVATQYKSFAGAYKAVAIGETIISTYRGAQETYTQLVKAIPGPYGVAAGIAGAVVATASGLARVAQIKEQKFAHGGTVQGSSTTPNSRDNVPALLTPGEMVFNGQQQRNLLAMANGTGGGGGVNNTIEINIENGDAETVRGAVNGALADTYQERIQNFSDMENEVDALDVGAQF